MKKATRESRKYFFISKGDIKQKYYKNYKIKGKYINQNFLIDNKIKNKTPGFNVITPFKLDSSQELILSIEAGFH